MKFTYGSGTRPLDGYTIKRGIGQGGFGEVYYGLSDGGKEVALKLVRGNLEVELRGMAQCLNLKHPNLVSLYDIRSDAQGDRWVVMEYVSGESLSSVLNRHPRGLSVDLARQWFLDMSRAVGHLHDNGIVHRDLKPANIFLENGMVKVGDYGLSKFISSSQRSAQTQSVGTVHYMAPEVSTGNYGKQIDIYAAGVILYEMLTGHVPFDGESAGEILMKHLTASPDLSKLPPGWAEIVGSALAKDPANRFASFAEMARALERIGPRVAASAVPVLEPLPVRQSTPPMVLPAEVKPREKVAELCLSMVLSVMLAILFAIISTALFANRAEDWRHDGAEFGATALLLVFGSWLVLVPSKWWNERRGDPWQRRGLLMAIGLCLGIVAAWVNGWNVRPMEPELTALSLPPVDLPRENFPLLPLFGYMSYFGLAFLLLRWWKLVERTRGRRFSFFPVLVAGCLSMMLYPLWPEMAGRENSFMTQGPLVLTLVAAIVQIVSPWEEPAPRPARRLRLRYA
jgi:eukaryotic-like serine/threonine-protein kinase